GYRARLQKWRRLFLPDESGCVDFEDTVQKLINFYENYHNKVEIGILSPIHLDGSEKKLEIFVEKYLSTNAVKDRIFTDLLLNQNRKYFELDFINAAHWFLPKDTVEKVGGFNPYFFSLWRG
ncbi:MAG TPA: hypothetical protein PKV58_06450, partial [Kaistella sp.]|nr:hypothetical protein [Kaistella sp.]